MKQSSHLKPSPASQLALISALALSLGACAPAAPPTGRPGPSATPGPTVSAPTSSQVPAAPQDSIALRVAAQAGSEGIKPLSEFKLPTGTGIGQVKVVSASLDGRDLDPADLSLGNDAQGNLVFFMAKSAFSEAFAGTGTSVAKSIHSSAIFAQKTQQVRTQLLADAKASLRSENETLIPEPDFLKAAVRGAELTRQMVGALKKDGGKLAKEGIFIDRSFYAVLAVGKDRFAVSQAAANNLILKLTLAGPEIETLIALLAERLAPGKLLSLPAIAEKIAAGDASFFAPIGDLREQRLTIEIEEIEEMLEFEIGSELTPAGLELRDIELGLDLSLMLKLIQAHPELSAEAVLDARDDSGESLEQILARAKSREDAVVAAFASVGKTPIDDQALFDPTTIERQLFTGFSYMIQSLAQPSPSPNPQQTAVPVPAGSGSPAPLPSGVICATPPPCAQLSTQGFSIAGCPGAVAQP